MSQRILVVDGDLAVLSLLHDVLAHGRYRVACASTLGAGLLALAQERPALIILDLHLERPDVGWQLLGRIRAQPTTAAIPIIVCTADWHALDVRADALRTAGCATVKKPFEVHELWRLVAVTLAAARARETLAVAM